MAVNNECEASVCTDGWHYFQCRKKAKVEVEGKHYCGIHNPIRLKELADKWALKYHENDCRKCGSSTRSYYKYCPWCGTKKVS